MKIYDMLLAQAMGEGGGGGGGGSSDLSTAQVTVIGDTGTFVMYCAYDDDNSPMKTSMFRIGDDFSDYIQAEPDEPVTGTLYWVGNSAVLNTFVVTSITGDAVYDAESRNVTVSGDCTITGLIDD